MKSVWGFDVRTSEEDNLSEECVCEPPRACLCCHRPPEMVERDLLYAYQGLKDTTKGEESVEDHLPTSITQGASNLHSDEDMEDKIKLATSVALAADLTRTSAVAISGTLPDREGVAASHPLQYGAHRPWVHTVDAEVILHLLQHADRERTTGVPAGTAKVVNQMPLRWLRDGLRARGQHAGHPFWYVRATSHHSNTLLHKADWAAS